VITGRAPAGRTPPGVARTYTVEALLPGGRAMQVGCAHSLADNYGLGLMTHQAAQAGVAVSGSSGGGGYQDQIYEMAAGLPNGALRAAVLAHGDDAGLRLPPALAPVQVCRWLGGWMCVGVCVCVCVCVCG